LKEKQDMRGKNFDIFISYRRSDGDAIARILNAEFALRDFRCFLDFDNLKGGKFDERIEDAIIDAPVFVMVLTPDYFSRCNEKGDWVRREIELALAKEKIIVPINYDKNLNGIPDYLEEDFKKRIGCHQFATIHKDDTFKSSFNQMVEERILNNIGNIINTENKAKVSVLSDIDCDLVEDNQLIATVQKDETNFILLERGEHAIIARSNEHPEIKEVIEKTINDISFKYLLKIELANQVQERKNAIAEKQKAEKDAIKLWQDEEKRRQEEIKRRQDEEKRRQEEEKRREEEEKRREEEKEKRKQKRKEWWGRNKRKLLIALAVIFGIAIIIGLNNSSLGETETLTETATEIPEKFVNEELFDEYVRKAEEFDIEYISNTDNKNLLDSVRYYYELALEIKDNKDIRERLKGL
jgi:hypothetical protein